MSTETDLDDRPADEPVETGAWSYPQYEEVEEVAVPLGATARAVEVDADPPFVD
jgi:hypothetical protein